jgi:hypothetical protein
MSASVNKPLEAEFKMKTPQLLLKSHHFHLSMPRNGFQVILHLGLKEDPKIAWLIFFI